MTALAGLCSECFTAIAGDAAACPRCGRPAHRASTSIEPEGTVADPRVSDPRVSDPRVSDPRVSDPRVAEVEVEVEVDGRIVTEAEVDGRPSRTTGPRRHPKRRRIAIAAGLAFLGVATAVSILDGDPNGSTAAAPTTTTGVLSAPSTIPSIPSTPLPAPPTTTTWPVFDPSVGWRVLLFPENSDDGVVLDLDSGQSTPAPSVLSAGPDIAVVGNYYVYIVGAGAFSIALDGSQPVSRVGAALSLRTNPNNGDVWLYYDAPGAEPLTLQRVTIADGRPRVFPPIEVRSENQYGLIGFTKRGPVFASPDGTFEIDERGRPRRLAEGAGLAASGRLLVRVACTDDFVCTQRITDIETKRDRATLPLSIDSPLCGFSLSPDGSTLVSFDTSSNELVFIDVATGRLDRQDAGEFSIVPCEEGTAWSPDGQWLLLHQASGRPLLVRLSDRSIRELPVSVRPGTRFVTVP